MFQWLQLEDFLQLTLVIASGKKKKIARKKNFQGCCCEGLKEVRSERILGSNLNFIFSLFIYFSSRMLISLRGIFFCTFCRYSKHFQCLFGWIFPGLLASYFYLVFFEISFIQRNNLSFSADALLYLACSHLQLFSLFSATNRIRKCEGVRLWHYRRLTNAGGWMREKGLESFQIWSNFSESGLVNINYWHRLLSVWHREVSVLSRE